ncbi:MAG: MCE family protein, partial [Planctomycetota bacterium]|nr:MCE family protein [Planctomycetota bacterium]
MARREFSNVEVKAGVFLAFCLALFVGMLLLYGKIPRLWRVRQEVRAVFSSVASLKPDAAVLYNGVEVGRVKSMRILHLDKETADKLAPMTKRDLDFLPLGEGQRKKLRLAPDYEFDPKVREALV